MKTAVLKKSKEVFLFFMVFVLLSLIRHLELAVVLIAVGEGDGDHVTACAGEVGGKAIGRPNRGVFYPVAQGGGDIDLDRPEVLGEGYCEGMAVDIG